MYSWLTLHIQGSVIQKIITEKDETVKSSGLCANGAGFAEDRL